MQSIAVADRATDHGRAEVKPHYGHVVPNARLIAAAPELYEALRGVLEVAACAKGAYTTHGALMEQARAALAKVEGR